jgi:hypothetical protein
MNRTDQKAIPSMFWRLVFGAVVDGMIIVSATGIAAFLLWGIGAERLWNLRSSGEGASGWEMFFWLAGITVVFLSPAILLPLAAWRRYLNIVRARSDGYPPTSA